MKHLFILALRHSRLFPHPSSAADRPNVLTLDIAPSILELCNAKPLDNIHGKSWVKLVRNGADPDSRTAWFYEYNYEKQFPYTPNVRAIRTDQYKYIHYPHGDGSPDRYIAELYDLKADPEEDHNLIKDPSKQQLIESLKIQLAVLMKQSGLDPANDKMPIDAGIGKELPDRKIR